MKMNKILLGEALAVSTATGVVPVSQGQARPARWNAASVNQQLDGPYNHFGLLGFSRISVQVTVIGEEEPTGVGEAKVALEVTNGDPNDSATVWHELDATAVLDGGVTRASEMMHAIDLAYLYGRLVWSDAADAPDLLATIVLV